MTDLPDPRAAEVFIVGRNQATGFATATLPSHDVFVDALLNRNGQTCRGLYETIRGAGRPSRTRTNLDRLRQMLVRHGVDSVLETNVVCYSTPMSAELRAARHREGATRGSEIFSWLLDVVRPQVLIAHGSGTRKDLVDVVGVELPPPASRPVDPVARAGRQRPWQLDVVVIPSLAPPAWNRWSSWADEHLKRAAVLVADLLEERKLAKT